MEETTKQVRSIDFGTNNVRAFMLLGKDDLSPTSCLSIVLVELLCDKEKLASMGQWQYTQIRYLQTLWIEKEITTDSHLSAYPFKGNLTGNVSVPVRCLILTQKDLLKELRSAKASRIRRTKNRAEKANHRFNAVHERMLALQRTANTCNAAFVNAMLFKDKKILKKHFDYEKWLTCPTTVDPDNVEGFNVNNPARALDLDTDNDTPDVDESAY